MDGDASLSIPDFTARLKQKQKETIEFVLGIPERIQTLQKNLMESRDRVEAIFKGGDSFVTPANGLALAEEYQRLIFVGSLSLKGIKSCLGVYEEFKDTWIPTLQELNERKPEGDTTVEEKDELLQLLPGVQILLGQLIEQANAFFTLEADTTSLRELVEKALKKIETHLGHVLPGAAEAPAQPEPAQSEPVQPEPEQPVPAPRPALRGLAAAVERLRITSESAEATLASVGAEGSVFHALERTATCE